MTKTCALPFRAVVFRERAGFPCPLSFLSALRLRLRASLRRLVLFFLYAFPRFQRPSAVRARTPPPWARLWSRLRRLGFRGAGILVRPGKRKKRSSTSLPKARAEPKAERVQKADRRDNVISSMLLSLVRSKQVLSLVRRSIRVVLFEPNQVSPTRRSVDSTHFGTSPLTRVLFLDINTISCYYRNATLKPSTVHFGRQRPGCRQSDHGRGRF